jgi:pyruvate kinase
MIKTKIIATLGPATTHTENIKALIDSGVNVFRLNFSHGSLEEHADVLDTINKLRSESSHTLAVMGDLCGPKIRTSQIEHSQKSSYEGPERRGNPGLKKGDEVVIVPNMETGTINRFGTNYEHFNRDIQPGDRVLIDDGQIELRVIDKDDNQTTCTVIVGGFIQSHKGINLPDTKVSTPSITERDWECAAWAVEHQLDYLALSFVRSAEEINHLKKYLRDQGSPIKIISKIEKPEAIENLESIVHVSDAVLVARGDLGVEMDLAQVPLIQKQITKMCRRLGKPVIVATQMLQSMIEAPVPTRAEVSDVANAIMDFADAVMLSGETAVGKYPIEAVRTIKQIAHNTEAFMDEHCSPRPQIETDDALAITATLARSVAQMLDEVNARLVVTWSQTGGTARLLSKSRIDAPIIAFSSDELFCRQMSLHYGVIPIYAELPADTQDFIRRAEETILAKKWAERFDRIIVLPGAALADPPTSHTIMLHTIS